ncbi:hypothetical protein DFH09DRAFT_850383, partial [Mycena vulgaris]
TGPGPERAVYCLAIATAIHNPLFWVEAGSSGFHIPLYTAAPIEIPERCQTFTALGSLLALHCYALAQGPIPVSVWLLVALTSGQEGLLLPNDVLAALDPVAFDMLAPWLTMTPTDPVPTNFLHPLCQFLMNVMEIQPTQIATPRTQKIHDGWTMTFMSKVLLGSQSFWNHPEFLALQCGFDIAVGDTSVVKHISQRLVAQKLAVAMLACLYDRKGGTLKMLPGALVRSSANGTTPYFAALLRLLFGRYLSGVGHPPQLRGALIDEDEWVREADNGLLRVGLLLEATTDTDLRPTAQSWLIK